MAQIPVGNAGFRVPSGAPTPRVGAGPGLGDALVGVGRMGSAVADDMRREEAARQHEQDVLAREQAREVRAARRQQAQIDAGTRSMQAELDMEDLQSGLAERLRAGEIDQDKYASELSAGIQKIRGTALDGADPEWAPLVEKSLIGAHKKTERAARATITDANKRGVLSKLSEATELLGRAAIADPATAIARADALYDGAAGTLGADAVAKGKAAFREQAWRSHFLRGIEANRDNPRGLDALRTRISSADALDPNQQTALLTSIDARQQLLTNRAQAASERRDRQAQQAFEALQSLDAQGLPADPEFLSATLGKLKGTAYEEAARAIVAGSVATAKFGALPVAQQDAVLMAEYAKARENGLTPARAKQLKKLEGIRDAAVRAYKEDPWQAALERGQIDPPAPLDLSSPDAAMTSLTERMAQAPTVDRLAGRHVTPLRPDEARVLGDMLERMPIPERTRFLGGIGKVIGGRRLEDLSRQLGAKNNELGIAAAMEAHQFRTQSGRSVAELYLQGKEAIQKKIIDPEDKRAAPPRSEIYALIGDAYTSPEARDAAVDVALALWAGQKAQGGRPSAEGVVRLATGGIMEINGRKTPMPYGWTEDEMRQAINRVDGAAIAAAASGNAATAPLKGSEVRVRVGDSVITASDLAAQIGSVQLRSAGANRYAMQIGGRIVTREDGQPFTISLARP